MGEAGTPAGSVSPPVSSEVSSEMSPASLALERVLRERERVIEAQAAQIADLRAALDAERESKRLLGDALAREQMLRALPAPEPPPVAEEIEPPISDQAEPEPETPAAPEISFWARLWGRLKD